MKQYKNIVLRVPNWLGDACMSMPAVTELVGLFPGARLTITANPLTAPLFHGMSGVSDVLVYDRAGEHKGFAGKLRFARLLRQKNFDLSVLFPNSFESALLSYLAGIPEITGYARHLRGFLLTRPVEFTERIAARHQVFCYLNIIKNLGAAIDMEAEKKPLPLISVSREETGKADILLKENGMEGFLVGLSPGASYGLAKRWGIEGFKEAAEAVIKKRGNGAAVIFGGREDVEAAEELSKILNVKNLNLAGKTGLRDFLALAGRMNLFIANDSGAMHASAALSVPTLAIFGSTDPNLTGPLGRRVRVVREKLECSPCFKRECPYGHYKCLVGVKPARVISEAEEMLVESCGQQNESTNPCGAHAKE